MTITVNGQEMSDDDIKTVTAAIRQAKKAEAKEKAAREADHAAAKSESESVAYGMYALKHGNGYPKTFELIDPYADLSPVRISRDDVHRITMNIEARKGSGSWHGFGLRPVTAVIDGSGLCRLIFMRSSGGDDPAVYAMAVGASGGVAVLTPCPGITMDEFPRTAK